MMDWQPIETAPKDCTVIIGMYVRSYGPPEHEKWCESASMMWEGGPGRIAGGYWSYTGYCANPIPKECQPTHWMPSPEPPEPLEGSK